MARIFCGTEEAALVNTVGDGVLDVPAVTDCPFSQLPAKSQHFQTGRPGGRPLHRGSSAVRVPSSAFVTMTGEFLSKIAEGKSFQYPKKTKYHRIFMQNVQVLGLKSLILVISSIILVRNLYKFTLSTGAQMWYVMHGVSWVYSAHNAQRFLWGPGVSGCGRWLCFIVRSGSAGGYPHFLETRVPKSIRKNEIISKEL